MESKTINTNLAWPCYCCKNNSNRQDAYPCRYCEWMPGYERWDDKAGDHFRPILDPE